MGADAADIKDVLQPASVGRFNRKSTTAAFTLTIFLISDEARHEAVTAHHHRRCCCR